MPTKKSPESHEVEWKASWDEKYMKWLCGYANEVGGHLFIGVNDDGFVIGLKNVRILLEQLPNKIRDELGIVPSIQYHSAKRRGVNIRYDTDGTKKSLSKIPERILAKDVNRYAIGLFKPKSEKEQKKLAKLSENQPIFVNEDGTLDYIEITIEPYPYHLVTYHGKAYRRSGSTLQELNGAELEKFVIERSGRSWDALPVPNVSVSDLSKDALKAFRTKAVKRKRRTRAQVNESDMQLLEDLNVIDDEGNLSRAAILFFHPNPEKYITGAYIKIGFFGRPGEYGKNTYNDVIYHDDIHGPAVLQIDQAVEVIYTKYLKALISYRGIQRIETFMWPVEAFREILLNAINNKEYRTGNPIQIKVYDDHISVFNEGHWPVDKLAVADVYEEHSSYPQNPNLANLFYAAGEIEKWGSGFQKIQEECQKVNAPLPEIEIGEGNTPNKGVVVRMDGCDLYMKLLRGEGKRNVESTQDNDAVVTERVSPDVPSSDTVYRMMRILSESLTDREKKTMLPVVEYLKQHKVITSRLASEQTGRGAATAQRYLNRLVSLDVLERQGSSVKTFYILKEE